LDGLDVLNAKVILTGKWERPRKTGNGVQEDMKVLDFRERMNRFETSGGRNLRSNWLTEVYLKNSH